MVAYSFKPQFRAPILAGTKRQTIRADRKRHARPGEQVQLYTGMRTRQCALIGRATCIAVSPVRLWVGDERVHGHDQVEFQGALLLTMNRLDEFAREDGFPDWSVMRDFWRRAHPGIDVFSGVLIQWGGLEAAHG